MPKTKITRTTAASPDVAAAAAQFLSPIVLDLMALTVNGKQAHWHVRGANFQAVHELLDTVVEHAQAYADLAAERVVALGLPIDSRVATVAAKTTLPALTPGFQQSDTVVREVIAQIDAALKTVRTAVDELDELDDEVPTVSPSVVPIESRSVALSSKVGPPIAMAVSSPAMSAVVRKTVRPRPAPKV
ncbi:MAG: DNA starvation/stationary phase protection protein [Hydrogenophaga sp.]|nr:DNA starvation/stationary phase protection protein [Hydrogenophaga sp.]